MRPLNDNNNLHITGIDSTVTENDLRKHFEHYGTIVSVKIMSYPSHLTGFVAFARASDAENARIALNGTQLGGHTILVVWAKKSLTLRGSNLKDAPLPAPLQTLPQSTSTAQIIEVRPPGDLRTRALVRLVAKLVSEYGSAMEQAALMSKDPKLEFIQPDHKFHNYYLCNVIAQIYSSFDLKPPSLIKVTDEVTLHYQPDEKEEPIETLSEGIIRSARNSYSADEACSELLNSVMEKAPPPPSHTLPIPAHESPPELMDFLTNLQTLDRHGYTIKALTSSALQINSQNLARGIISFFYRAETLELKMATTYLIHDILCNVTCDVSNSWRFKIVFFQRLPLIIAHWREICVHFMESGRSCAPISKRIYTILYVWRACAVFSSDYLDGLEMTFLPDYQDPNWPKQSLSENLSQRNPLSGGGGGGGGSSNSLPPPAADGRPLDEDLGSSLSNIPLGLRREFYLICKSRDDIWSLRAMCEKNGLPFLLTDSHVKLMQLLLKRLAYTAQRQNITELPYAPIKPLEPSFILSDRGSGVVR